MPDRAAFSKNEINTILDVNKKAIELHTEVSGQYEEIIDEFDELDSSHKKILTELDSSTKKILAESDKSAKKISDIEDEVSSIKKNIDKIDRDLFKISVIMSSSIISLILTIIQMFIKK